MDKRICVYPAGETDFASNGMGCLSPTSCKVHWAMDGEWKLPINAQRRMENSTAMAMGESVWA